jgi:hypothetical protein
MAGFMAYALPAAARLIDKGAFAHAQTHPDVSEHFSWHFGHWARFKDLAEAVQGELFKGYLSRNYLALQARRHLFGFVHDAAILVAAADTIRMGQRYRLRRLGSSPWASGLWWPSLKFALPGFSMKRMAVPQALAALADAPVPLWVTNLAPVAAAAAAEPAKVAA